jgi:hypothetical protein
MDGRGRCRAGEGCWPELEGGADGWGHPISERGAYPFGRRVTGPRAESVAGPVRFPRPIFLFFLFFGFSFSVLPFL